MGEGKRNQGQRLEDTDLQGGQWKPTSKRGLRREGKCRRETRECSLAEKDKCEGILKQRRERLCCCFSRQLSDS